MTTSSVVPTVRLRCPDCGPVLIPGDGVSFVHTGGIVVGLLCSCPHCVHPISIDPGPTALRILHAFGVTRSVEVAHTRDHAADDLEREIVSLRILLEDESFLDRLRATRRTTESTPSA